MRIAELVTAIVLGVMSVYIMWKSGLSEWHDGWGEPIRYIEGEGPGSGWWPFYLAGAMLLCCVWVIVNWVRRASPPSRSTAVYLDRFGLLMLLKVGGGVIGFVALVDIIGMYGAMSVFLLYYVWILGRHSLKLSLAIALGAPVVTFFFFDVAMRIVLPKGYLEPLFIPLYDIFL
ncbi:MAG: tripartite tricarboxylate transporter TctB family protein [Pseudomonadota bacterium]